MSKNRTLSSGFLRSVEAFGGNPAVEVSGKMFDVYELFLSKLASLAATLDQA